MATGKPGILTRLSNLIIIQVVFIFAALALILFTPSREREKQERLTDRQRQLVAAGNVVRPLVHPDQIGALSGIERERIDELLASYSTISRAAVLLSDDSLAIDVLYAYSTAADDPEVNGMDVSDFVDVELFRSLSHHSAGNNGGVFLYHDYLCHYVRWDIGPEDRATYLVLAQPHNLALSSREHLKYAILVLFLCSTLISLLTVKFLSGRFRRPLDRIIGGLEETAGGKLHQINDLNGDPHLGRLARAYNRMAETLWEQRRELDAYVSRLANANTSLSESRQFLAALIDLSPLAVVVADPLGKVMIFNRAASETFGYAESEIIGREFDELMAAGGERRATKRVLGGRNTEFELIGRRANGECFPLYVVSCNVETAEHDGPARLYICRGITESRNFQDMMIRLDRYYTRGEMAGDIAHEINNYLAVLMGNVELMPRYLHRGDTEKIEKKLEVMKNTLDKIACFSDGLLDSPPEKVRLEPTSLNQVIQNVIAFLEPQNKFDQVEVNTALADDLPVVSVDPMQTQQLLVNLIYNAAEALADIKGTRTITITTRQVAHEAQPGVQIEVRDNGHGVPEDKVDRLFQDRFTTKKRGHGIGLTSCQKIVENHKGSIDYRLDQGAVFTVRLPVDSMATETFVTEDDFSATTTT